MLQGLFVSGCSLKSNLHYQDSLTMIFFHIECMSSTGETHTLVCTPRGNCFCEALWSTVCPCFQLEKKKQESKPDNTFSGQTKWLVSMGIKFVNTSSTHTHTQSPTYTLHHHTMPQHLFLSCKYKTTLTGALSALVELSRWNVYLYIQMAWCHVVSHNVSWTNNVSHFSIRPAALKPPF